MIDDGRILLYVFLFFLGQGVQVHVFGYVRGHGGAVVDTDFRVGVFLIQLQQRTAAGEGENRHQAEQQRNHSPTYFAWHKTSSINVRMS